MATRSEQFHATQQRHRSKAAQKRAVDHAAKKPRLKKKLHAHENLHAARKATVALEKGKSRKSTRGSANRLKYDTNVELRGERSYATPQAKHRRK